MIIKKWIWSFILISIFIIQVEGLNRDTTTGIREDITYINDLEVIYTIPDDMEDDSIILSSNIFKELTFLNKDYFNDIQVHLSIDNHSKYIYSIENVLFDHLDYDDPKYSSKAYFCFNNALKDLIPSNKIGKDFVHGFLLLNGYTSLEKYYVNYYNKLYHFSYSSLNEFPTFVINDIFSGECLDDHYGDGSINHLVDSYLLKDVFYIKFKKHKYFIDDLIDNPNTFKIERNNSLDFVIGYDSDNMQYAFRDYGYNIYMEIELKKEEILSPPNTGI